MNAHLGISLKYVVEWVKHASQTKTCSNNQENAKNSDQLKHAIVEVETHLINFDL